MFYRPIVLLCLLYCNCSFAQNNLPDEKRFVYYIANPQQQDIKLYWKNDKNELYRSIGNLKSQLAKQKQILVFAMNAGMYQEDNSPLGLFIENKKVLRKINFAQAAKGNFYLQPNGVFYLDERKKAAVVPSKSFKNNGTVVYATQSGPMLLVNGKMNSAFKKGSFNLNIRNGVGILADGRILFVQSKREINFYDFAACFQKAGCRNALYLDGFVSRTYLPEMNWRQEDGNFGVMIGVVK